MIFLVFFVFLNINLIKEVRNGDIGGVQKAPEIALSVGIQEVDARCNLFCIAQKIAQAIWDYFMGQSSGNSGQSQPSGSDQPFGGRILAIIPCICSGGSAFIIDPVGGSEGPYFLPWYTGALKKWWAPLPGNWSLGLATEGGTCSILVFSYCFDYETEYQISPPTPGMGTSLIPGF